MAGQALTADTIGVAHSDGAAIHVQQFSGNTQLVATEQHLNCKGFIQFPQVDVLHRQTQTFQHFGNGIHRSDAHFIRFTTGHRKAQETAQRFQIALGGQVFAHDDASTGTIGKLGRVASRHHATGHGGFDACNAFFGGAVTQTFIHTDGDLLGHHAHDLVDHTGLHRDGCDFIAELACRLRSTRFLLAGGTVLVHGITADVVALGHLLGGLQHVPVNLWFFLVECRVHQHVLVHFLLHTGNAFHTTGHIHLAFTRDDAL